MKQYFKRQIELWGEEKQESLSSKRVLIVGCGGLGSSVGIALGSSGIGEITVIDHDTVDRSNIHRQIAFKLSDVGESKAKVLSKLIEDRCPFVSSNYFVEKFEDFAKRGMEFDLIIDATDNLPTREQIDRFAKSTKTPWLYTSVEEFNSQVCLFKDSSFGSAFVVNDRTPKGIAAPMVIQAASFEANLAIRYLTGLPVKTDTLYYLYFDKDGEFSTKSFKMPV